VTWGLFLPLVLGAVAYGVISVVAGVISSRGNQAGAERVRDYGFLLLLAIAAWIVILVLVALINKPNSVGDMLIIMLVVVAFFAILLLVFFGISQLIGMVSRGMTRRKRVTTDEL
jgi:Kef-type K+ transport system membrane component KefB